MLRMISVRLTCLLLFIIVVQANGEDKNLRFYEEGKASYYAKKFEGKRTASGEVYSSNLFTGAHRTLPFGSKVLVTNMSNGKTIVVKINDRGPFVRGRVIDLSYAGAKAIGMIQSGVANVSVKSIPLRVNEKIPTLPNTPITKIELN